MDVIDTIYKRRSIRNYAETPVERDTIVTLLRAAMAAPTAINYQPWEFIVVTDEEKLARVKKECIFARYNAPAAIVVCGNMKLARKGLERDFWIQDCSAAVENILIAATSLGLGSPRLPCRNVACLDRRRNYTCGGMKETAGRSG